MTNHDFTQRLNNHIAEVNEGLEVVEQAIDEDNARMDCLMSKTLEAIERAQQQLLEV